MKRILIALALFSTQAFAQTQFPPNTLWGNPTGSQGFPQTVTTTQFTGMCNQFTAALGGCVNAMTKANGGIVWSDATKLNISGVGTLGQCLLSGGAGVPTWGSCVSGSGAITSITSSGNTLTVAGTTTINLDLNLAHSNTWTAAQTFSGTIIANGVTLSSATQPHLHVNNPSGSVSVISFENASTQKSILYWDNSINTMMMGSVTSGTITFMNNSTSIARIQTSGGLSVGSANIGTDGGDGGIVASNMTLGATATPRILLSPSSGATKIGSIVQSGDLLVFGASGVGNYLVINLNTGSTALNAGVTCSGTPTSSFTSVTGVITHC